MAQTRIKDIFAAVAAIGFTTRKPDETDVAIAAYFLGTLKTWFIAERTPARILLPFNDNTQVDATTYSFGGAQDLEWKITDMLLYTPLDLTGAAGAEVVVEPLMDYMAAYIQALPPRTSLMRGVVIEKLSGVMGLFNYPLGSNDWYYGVEHTLTIKELVG